ncbi:hypothetical protein BDZ89DRAFT_898810, partial [Hymenopellis radicata]
LIRPIPPTPYDGSVDSEKFHRFGMEIRQFCKEGKVPDDERVFLASHYLRGKAHSYFIQKVSGNHSKWTLDKFLQGLFNYCFPITFKSEQRDNIKNCFQGRSSVTEYAYRLESLYGLVGVTSKRERVIKLWDGLRAELRRELAKTHFSKEVHSWKKI